MTKFAAIALLVVTILPAAGADDYEKYDPYQRGLCKDPNTFRIGVWLQQPRHASAYKALGINYYLGFHNDPAAQQMDLLRKSGMRVIAGLMFTR